MRTSTLAFVCAVLLGACAWGESSKGDDDDPPPPDASTQAVCGDGTCASSEVGKCMQDCGGTTTPVCGNGTCQPPTETNATCPSDCPPSGPVCGDTVCDMAGGENSTTCPGDCTASSTCPADPTECFLCVIEPTLCPPGLDPTTCEACITMM